MIFLTSFAYAVLFPLLALTLPQAAQMIASGLGGPVLVGMHAAAYALILFLVRVLRFAWEDISGKTSKHERLVKAWLEVRGCRWLNFAGLVTVGAGAVFLWIAGDFPQQLWFLHAAIVVGFLDILGKDRLLELPGQLPTPRVADLVAPEVPAVAGKQCSFTWHPWSDDLRALSCEKTFPIRIDEYNKARSQERFPTAEVRNLARYVRDGHCDSVAQVIVFFRRRSIEHALTAEQEMEDVVCFARSVVYVPDIETRGVEDWANFPVETLYDQAGDCEDHAILAANVLHALGHDVALFWISLRDSAHLALGYRAPGVYGGPFSRNLEGRDYSYVETVPTDAEQRIGDISYEFLKELKSARLIGL
jgi:hypothetical protein